MKLSKILYRKGYVPVKMKKINSNHFVIKAKVNGVKGRFILDTGASNSCIGTHLVNRFNLTSEDSDAKVAGAGTTGIETQIASKNKIVIADWKYNDFTAVLIDLSHISEALKEYYSKEVHGIIGAEILDKGKAIIDYKKRRLYLKKIVFKY